MGLQSSGAISIGDIATEFGGSTPHSLSEYYGVASGIPASGAISIKDFYGKANIFAFSISSNVSQLNLRTAAINAGWNQSAPVEATINSGVYVYSGSTGSYALDISGSFPNGVTLINNGTVVGRGGGGGTGDRGYGRCFGYSSNNGTAGGTGGPAVYAGTAVTIQNNGRLAGGGGGGGGGGSPNFSWGGGGGGGGTGNGSAGSGGAYGYNGSAGSLTGGGSGGPRRSGAGAGCPWVEYSGAGGSGGAYGSSGAGGASGDAHAGQGGGGAGNYIVGNSNVTWAATGTRNGGAS